MISAQYLYDCVFSRWSPQFGDPDLIGWVTVGFYGVAALLCVRAFWQWPDRLMRVFGLGLAVLLVVLMVNKQLDLQSALHAVGRCVSQAQGWYDDRQQVKVVFLLGLVSGSMLLAAVVFWVTRRHLPMIWPALVGLFCLLVYVAVRAAGIGHSAANLGARGAAQHVFWGLEMGGIALIALNALWVILRRRSLLQESAKGQA